MTAKPSPSDSANENDRPAEDVSFRAVFKEVYETVKLYIALLGLVAALPAAAQLVDDRLNVHDMRVSLAICMIPALVSLFWLIPKWFEQRHRKWAIDFGVHGEVKTPDYFRLTPHDASSKFYRADNFHEIVYSWVANNASPLLSLSGASGSGKSSIVSAWVVPKLLKEKVAPCILNVRIVNHPESAIMKAVLTPGAIWERPPSEEKHSTREVLEKAAKRLAPKKLILIMDQFEEFLILADSQQRNNFTKLLQALGESPIPGLQALMILRSDYRPLLGTLDLPEFEKDNLEVPPFFERDAIAFLQASGLSIKDKLQSEILEEAREVEQTPGLIRPITINIFGLVLRRYTALPTKYRHGVLRTYLSELIERGEIRDVAPLLLSAMITRNGTKIPVTCGELSEKVGFDPRQVRGCLVQLANEGVVRELDRGQGKWEIAHDFIAILYYQILAARRGPAWPRLRPWIAGSSLIAWGLAVAGLIVGMPLFEENRAQQALIEAGFTRQACHYRAPGEAEGCQAWAAPGLLDSNQLAASLPLLKKLDNLRSLSLARTKVNQVGAVSGIPQLESLNLSDTDVADLSFVSKLPNLRDLDITKTRIDDLGALSRAKHLISLKLGGTKVSSIKAMADLPFLQILDLNDTQVYDLPPLSDLSALNEVYAANTHINSVVPLEKSKQLKVLVIDGTKIQTVETLSNFSKLETLVINRTLVTDVDVLKNLSTLRVLKMGHTDISDISSLRNLIGLEVLDLNETKIGDINFLQKMRALRELYFANTAVENVDMLRLNQSLQTLVFNRTRVSNIDAVARLDKLETLVISDIEITSSAPLNQLIFLKKIDISGTKIKDISGFSKFSRLETLNLSDTSVKNFDPLIGLKNLQVVNLPFEPNSTPDSFYNLLRKSSPHVVVYWDTGRL